MATPGGGTRLRPMGVGDILDETFRLYRRHFLAFVTAMAIVAVPDAVVSALLYVLLAAGTSQGLVGMEDPTAPGLVSMASAIVEAAAYWLGGNATIALTADAVLGRAPSIKTAYGLLPRRLPALLIAAVVSMLGLGLLALTCLGIPAAIYLGLGWTLAGQAIVLERAGGLAGLRRSARLIGGHRFRVLGLSAVMSVLLWILIGVPSGIATTIGLIVGSLFENAPWPMAATQVVSALISSASQALFGPAYWIMLTVLYYELRVRKEAFDLELMTARAEALPSTGPDLPGSSEPSPPRSA